MVKATFCCAPNAPKFHFEGVSMQPPSCFSTCLGHLWRTLGLFWGIPTVQPTKGSEAIPKQSAAFCTGQTTLGGSQRPNAPEVVRSTFLDVDEGQGLMNCFRRMRKAGSCLCGWLGSGWKAIKGLNALWGCRRR